MILHYYYARRFLFFFLTVAGVLTGFQVLIDLVEQIRRHGPEVSFGEKLQLTLLNAPDGIYQILPLIMILASIALFVSLSRSSELVVTRAAGRPALAALMAPVAVAALIGVQAVAMGNPIVAATSKRYQDLNELYRSGASSVVSVGRDGLWLRQGDATGQTVIRASGANSDATTLYDVTFVTYETGRGPVRRIEAAEASLTQGAWTLTSARAWALQSGRSPDETAEDFATIDLPSTLTQEGIRDSFGKPSFIPVWDLPAFVTQMEEAGFSARRYAVWFQIELARPLFLVAMVMIGAAFTMGHSRFGRTGLMVLLAVMLGFGLYYVRNFAQILGENGQLDARFAAWAPAVASILLALGLILHKEDG
ncbi:LPS export ABC transporter permease LptG [Mesobacterium pallidum]|uniref:LPS export ABC transporter permease LptG n=1 Tax=Mesobacterium pallidum TaxID=2872037 RepID=UPI001EE2BAA3|nr:LPS export ABC transporter permease LptG [Mesobacterium pallidum]